MSVELNEPFFAKVAGWEAMKTARALLALGKVLSSNYTPPILKGVVQDGTTSYRAGFVIRSDTDLENTCTCRASREWGTMCAHSVAVGLHWLKPTAVVEKEKVGKGESGPGRSAVVQPEPRRLRRAVAGEPGIEPLELHIILPPNFADAAVRGKVMLVVEGKWSRGRVPLNALPMERPYQLSAEDERLLSRIEEFAGEPAGMLVLTTKEFAELLPALAEHPRVTLGKTTPLRVTREPWSPLLRAELQANGEILLTTRRQDGKATGGLPSNPPALLEGEWAFVNHTLQPVALAKNLLGVLREKITITRQQVPAFLNNDFPRLAASGSLEANFSLDDFAVEQQPPKFLLHLTGGLAQLAAQLQCKYPSRVITAGAAGAGESPWMPDASAPTRYAMRDLSAEQQALGRLLRAGFSGPDAQGRYQLNGQERVLNFFAREYPCCKLYPWT